MLYAIFLCSLDVDDDSLHSWAITDQMENHNVWVDDLSPAPTHSTCFPSLSAMQRRSSWFFYLLFCFEMIVFILLFDNSLFKFCYKRALLNVPVHKEPNCERRSNPRWCRAYGAHLRRTLTHGCCNTWTVRICIFFMCFYNEVRYLKKNKFDLIFSRHSWCVDVLGVIFTHQQWRRYQLRKP